MKECCATCQEYELLNTPWIKEEVWGCVWFGAFDPDHVCQEWCPIKEKNPDVVGRKQRHRGTKKGGARARPGRRLIIKQIGEGVKQNFILHNS